MTENSSHSMIITHYLPSIPPVHPRLDLPDLRVLAQSLQELLAGSEESRHANSSSITLCHCQAVSALCGY